MKIEMLLNPTEYQSRRERGFAGAVCVVFDVLRATSVIVTGLANGAKAFVPVEEIAHALAMRAKYPGALLAGERDGLRITARQSGGVDFDLGNSPREYVTDHVAGRMIISTTTNGTRALRSCESADAVLCGSFLNLSAVADWIRVRAVSQLILVCAGTGDDEAAEDVLCAGALSKLLESGADCELTQAGIVAAKEFAASEGRLFDAICNSANGKRLLKNPDLCDDVAFCARRDVFQVVPVMDSGGVVRLG
jgi:2-phosphosulfolactate phosphatase